MTAYTEELIYSLTTLNRIAETLNRTADVASALNSALADLVDLMGLETGWIFLKDPAAKSQWFGRGFNLIADYNLPPGMRRDKAGSWKGGCDCQTLCSREALTSAYNQVRCTRLAAAKGDERSGLVMHASAPLRSGEQVLGILNVAAPGWESFTPEALALLANVGSLMGIALERARLYDLLQEQRIDEQAALLEFSNQLLSRPVVSDLLDTMLRELRRLLRVDAAALVTPNDQSDALLFRVASGWRENPTLSAPAMPSSEFNLIGQVMASQQPFLAEDIEAHVLPLYEMEWVQGEDFRGLCRGAADRRGPFHRRAFAQHPPALPVDRRQTALLAVDGQPGRHRRGWAAAAPGRGSAPAAAGGAGAGPADPAQHVAQTEPRSARLADRRGLPGRADGGRRLL
ncbi:MAG: GAF domain-containing protein [Anaerolineae bacterium]